MWNSTDPSVLFAIFAHPNNSALFRDIKCVRNRKILQESPGLRVVEVDQIGELKIMKARREYTTRMTVTEDSRDPNNQTIEFRLLQSNMLAKFTGSWSFSPLDGNQGCAGFLSQDVLPKGIPPAMAKLPLIGRILRRISIRAIERLMEDTNAAVAEIAKTMSTRGTSMNQALDSLCGQSGEHSNHQDIKSFAIEDDSDDEDDSDITDDKQLPSSSKSDGEEGFFDWGFLKKQQYGGVMR